MGARAERFTLSAALDEAKRLQNQMFHGLVAS